MAGTPLKSFSLLSVLAFYFSAVVVAHPTHIHSTRADFAPSRRAVDLDTFRLKDTPTTYVRASEVEGSAVTKLVKKDVYTDTATALVQSIAPGAEFRLVEDHYVGTNGIAHVYFKQTAHGLDIDNADFTVNIAADGSVFSYANGFYSGAIPAESPIVKRDETSDPVTALSSVCDTLALPVEAAAAAAEPASTTDLPESYTLTNTEGAVSDPEARLVYFVADDGTLALTWRVETDIYDDWLLTYVNAASLAANETTLIHGVVNYRADQAPSPATYLVYPWGVNDPSEAGATRETIVSPWDSTASEFGFNSDGTTAYNTLRGNNGVAQVNPSGATSSTAWQSNYRPTSDTLDFSYPYSPATTDPTEYRDAAITQLFYTSNMYHDVLYALGFTEAAGNFETNNNGQGGQGADMVILNAQDGSGTNNANFATPPDGQQPRMRMYLWTLSTPQRDCAFEAGVVIHEFTHGLSNRLTGGPSNTGCLSSTEAGGMGEGWSDFYATAIRLKSGDTRTTDYAMGAWVSNDPLGIRAYPYSTDMATNPLTYASVNGMTSVHAVGTVWATMLYEVMWNLIDKSGLSTEIMPVFDGLVPTDGKFLWMKLVTDGLALQPCTPNFVDARDAILDADVALTGGANACEIWTGFAKRGLGEGARYSSSSRTESFTLPAGVC